MPADALAHAGVMPRNAYAHRVDPMPALRLLRSHVLAAMAALIFGASGGFGGASTEWQVLGTGVMDYTVAIDSAVHHGGRASIRIQSLVAAPYGSASIVQPIRAEAYRGRRVRLSGYLRTRDVRGEGGGLSIGVASASGVTSRRSVDVKSIHGTTDWTAVQLEADVPENAAGITLTATLNGAGTLWVDDLSLQPIGTAAPAPPTGRPMVASDTAAMLRPYVGAPDAPAGLDFEGVALVSPVPRSPLEPPRPLTGRGLENVIAFARLFGVVRHFHPTEAVRTANWDDIAIRGVREVEGAPTPDSLAAVLRALFAPVAPTVRIVAGPSPSEPALAGDTARSDQQVATWINLGLSVGPPPAGQMSAYSSVLAVRPASLANPAPWSGDLGGGVSAVVPLEIVVPDSTAGTRGAVQPGPATLAASPNDRATRLAGVIVGWNVIAHSYPYFDVVHADWPAALRAALASAASDSTPDTYNWTLGRMMAALDDGHGSVIQGVLSYRPGQLPVALDWAEGHVVVTNTGDGAPAGIRAGDVVLSVEGMPIDSAMRRQESRYSGSTPQWRRVRAMRGLLFGTLGDTVAWRVQHQDGSASNVRIPVGPPVRQAERVPDKIAELRPGIFYVDLGRITNPDFAAALPRLAQARGIIFDMRGYPSGVNTPAVFTHLTSDTIHSDHFEPPTILRPFYSSVRYDRDGAWTIAPVAPRLTSNLAFLTGAGAISYAESTMGIVEDYHLADIVGAATAGTNGNINQFLIPGKFRLVFTGMLVVKRDGRVFQGVGVSPTVPVRRTIAGIARGADEYLDRAVELVEGRASAPTRPAPPTPPRSSRASRAIPPP